MQAGFTVNATAFDVPPPGAGVVTVMLKLPVEVRSLAGILAFKCVPSTKVVVRGEPAKFTPEFRTKLVPTTDIVKPAPPAVALVGEMLVMVGAATVPMVSSWVAERVGPAS